MRDMAYQYKNRSYKIKPYHLHPGNEVARALNVLSRTRKGILPYRYCAAVALRKAGFPVRWDVKAGRFV